LAVTIWMAICSTLAVAVVHLVEGDRGHVGERAFCARSPEVQVEIGRLPGLLVGRRDDDERRGIVDRQRPQQRVDQAEDRGIRTDAQRQREDGDEAEPRALDEHPEAVFEVLKNMAVRGSQCAAYPQASACSRSRAEARATTTPTAN
jgi:hypothetical protein